MDQPQDSTGFLPTEPASMGTRPPEKPQSPERKPVLGFRRALPGGSGLVQQGS